MRITNNIYEEQHKFLNYTTTGVFIINKNYEVLLWNKNIEQWTNIKDSEIIGKKLTDFFPLFSNSLYTKLLRNVFFEGMTTILSSKLHPDLFLTVPNKNIKLHTTILPTPDDDITFNALFSIEDQTILTNLINKNKQLNKKLEAMNKELEAIVELKTKELKASNMRLTSILNNAPVSIILLNKYFEILDINSEGLRNFETSFESIYKKNITDFLECSNHDEQSSKPDYLNKLINSASTASIKNSKAECCFFKRKNNEEKVSFIISATIIENFGEQNILLILSDITQRKKAEIDLIAAQKKAVESDKLKTAFLANLSHEIRTPLNGIVGFSSLITHVDIGIDEKETYAGIIKDSSDRLVNQVENIINASKLESNQLDIKISSVDINALIDNIYSKYSEKIVYPIVFNQKKEIDSKTYNINTDPKKIKLIFDHLLTNAIKFTNKGCINIGYNVDENYITFFVKDTGIGIPEEFQKKIFIPFSQAHNEDYELYGGTGLGLTISKGIVTLLGGNIWVESKPNLYSNFYFTIPTQL